MRHALGVAILLVLTTLAAGCSDKTTPSLGDEVLSPQPLALDLRLSNAGSGQNSATASHDLTYQLRVESGSGAVLKDEKGRLGPGAEINATLDLVPGANHTIHVDFVTTSSPTGALLAPAPQQGHARTSFDVFLGPQDCWGSFGVLVVVFAHGYEDLQRGNTVWGDAFADCIGEGPNPSPP